MTTKHWHAAAGDVAGHRRPARTSGARTQTVSRQILAVISRRSRFFRKTKPGQGEYVWPYRPLLVCLLWLLQPTGVAPTRLCPSQQIGSIRCAGRPRTVAGFVSPHACKLLCLAGAIWSYAGEGEFLTDGTMAACAHAWFGEATAASRHWAVDGLASYSAARAVYVGYPWHLASWDSIGSGPVGA